MTVTRIKCDTTKFIVPDSTTGEIHVFDTHEDAYSFTMSLYEKHGVLPEQTKIRKKNK